MFKHCKYLYGIPMVLIGVVFFACNTQKGASQEPPFVTVCDTANIAIDPRITREYPMVDSLLRSWIADKQYIFQQKKFRRFFASSRTRLVLSPGEFQADTSAISLNAQFDSKGIFRDTIFINKLVFKKASREFLAGVVIHESMHAYITWNSLSFKYSRNWVDTAYLKNNFRRDWKRITGPTYPDNEAEHILMTRDFIKPMLRTLYPFTNGQSALSLRAEIARSLTWGGLSETPKWRKLQDTCSYKIIDIWARHMDADSTKEVRWGQCRVTGLPYLDSLEMQPLHR